MQFRTWTEMVAEILTKIPMMTAMDSKMSMTVALKVRLAGSQLPRTIGIVMVAEMIPKTMTTTKIPYPIPLINVQTPRWAKISMLQDVAGSHSKIPMVMVYGTILTTVRAHRAQ